MPESKVKNERNADVALLSGLPRRKICPIKPKQNSCISRGYVVEYFVPWGYS